MGYMNVAPVIKWEQSKELSLKFDKMEKLKNMHQLWDAKK